jgi:general stress protein YciG
MPKTSIAPELRDYLAKIGRKGGKKGGRATALNRTPEQRSESARNAVTARWAKVKGKAPTSR